MASLWSRRDGAILLHEWLGGMREGLIGDLLAASRAMRDEGETLSIFTERAATGDCEAMTLSQFAGQGEGNDCVKLSTLHSSKGREFTIVILFAMDEGRLPRANPGQRELIENRRLFYVGFTRAKAELHMMYTANRPSRFVEEVQARLATE